MMPPIIVCCQSSLEAIKAPVPSCSSSVGSCNGSGTPYWPSSGPMARMITLFVPVPCTMNPPIITLSPVCTKARVEMLPSLAGGVGVGVGVGVTVGVDVGATVAVGVTVGVLVGLAVAVAIGLGLAVAVGVGDG